MPQLWAEGFPALGRRFLCVQNVCDGRAKQKVCGKIMTKFLSPISLGEKPERKSRKRYHNTETQRKHQLKRCQIWLRDIIGWSSK